MADNNRFRDITRSDIFLGQVVFDFLYYFSSYPTELFNVGIIIEIKEFFIYCDKKESLITIKWRNKTSSNISLEQHFLFSGIKVLK